MKKIIHLIVITAAFLAFARIKPPASNAARHRHSPNRSSLAPKHISIENNGWVIGVIDSAPATFNVSGVGSQIALDGQIHIAYASDYLYHAWNDGTDWQREVVDSSTLVTGTVSMALDSDSFTHISYQSKLERDLKYAYQDESGWHIETVDQVGYVGLASSIALDQNGNPHISYVGGEKSEERNLKYAYLDKTGWNVNTLDRGGITTGGGNSLVLDVDGYPHISYLEFNTYGPVSNTLKYAYQDSTGWQFEDVAGAVSGETSLGLDGKGQAHIIYPSSFLNVYAGISYAYRDEVGWHTSLIQGGTQHHFNSLTIDTDNNPHISFVSGMYKTVYEITYANLDIYDWRVYQVDFLADNEISGGGNSLALDKYASPHISYIDETGQNLMYAYRANPFPIYDVQFLPLVRQGDDT